MKQIAIIGAGSWGTALAVIAARAGHNVRLWSRNAEVVSSINEQRVNSRYLSSTSIPDGVTATGDIEAALQDASMVLLAVPSHAARETLTAMSPQLHEAAIIVSVAKGIEIESGKRISEIAKEVVAGSHPFVDIVWSIVRQRSRCRTSDGDRRREQRQRCRTCGSERSEF